MGGEIIRFIKVLPIFIVASLYCYFVASKFCKGKLRLLSLLPVFSLFVVLPLYFSSLLFTSSVALFVTWLTTFKLLLFSFDLGPLASNPPLSFPLFASVAFFPTRIKHNTTTPHGQEPPPKLPLNLPTKVVICVILILGDSYIDLVCPNNIKLWINCATLYFYLDVIMSLSNVFVRSTFGVEVRQPFNEPYLTTSLQNLWGRRWNLLVSETLHDTIYKPIRYKLGVPRWATVVSVFVVSGLMHELLYYYIVRAIPTWEATWFFVIHGVCLALEIELKRAYGKRWQLHWAVSRPLTLTFMATTCYWLLFPLMLRA
ncbi:unnamed protein product [Citrullus colocynthis]|uniref:Wax synthase domain-containing protein n=1 Tax=Citrullus colocynthis TaxID=252529 RepID=A0ABP0XPD6_9ROSI